MALWKQILLKSLGVGIGIGAGFAICVASYAWYSSRPKPPKPWDAGAITATFEHADTVGGNHHLRFLYSMESHTDFDYKSDTANLRVAAIIGEGNNLFGGTEDVKFEDESVFLPAKQRVLVSLELPTYTYPGSDVLVHDTPEERKKYRDAVKKYLNDDLPRLNGFAAYDEINRYRIDFPSGWKSTKSGQS
jgi:hypothetical protein